MSKFTCIATGDAFITRRIPAEGYEGLEALANLIGRHDVRFSNLEMTFHDMEGTPAAVSGGTWAISAAPTAPTFGFAAASAISIWHPTNN